MPNSVVKRISSYRLSKRGYDKRLPGFLLFSRPMLYELECLVDELSVLDISNREIKIKNLMNKYFCSLGDCSCSNVHGDNKIVIDQLVAPILLFDEIYGSVISDILDDVKIIIIRRNPRDQFIDLLLKKKKKYHLMSPDEAASKFVSEYLPRYDRMSAMLEQCDPGKVIDLWFEDIFFDFDKALDRMESFVGLSNRPSDFDNLDFSAASRKVKMYNKGEFSKEVALIEGDMRRHLYSY